MAREVARKVDAVHEEVDALRDCLLASGALSCERYLAALHRRRFRAVQHAHPWQPGRSLREVLLTRELALSVTSCLRGPEVQRLRTASAFERAAAVYAAPRRLFFVSGGLCESAEAYPRACSVELFDPVASRWEQLPPTAMQHYRGAPSIVLNGSLYLLDGQTDQVGESGVECFDFGTYKWSTLPPMPTLRSTPAAAALGSCLYVVGGSLPSDSLAPLRSVERFNPRCRRWEAAAPLSIARSNAAAVALSGRLYVCGGWGSARGNVSAVERLDPARDIWESLPPMCEPRGEDDDGKGATVVPARDCFYVLGGNNSLASGTIERFDLLALRWEVLPTLTVPRYDFADVAAIALGGCLYVLGGHGCSEDGGSLRSVERFDPARGVWEKLPEMAVARENLGVIASHGVLYAFGGKVWRPEANRWENLRSVERFDPTCHRWQKCQEMRHSLIDPKACVLQRVDAPTLASRR